MTLAPALRLRRLGVGAAVLLAVLLGLLFTATEASAHAVVVKSDPSDGGRLTKAPSSVSVTFDESVGLSLGYLRVVGESGDRADTGTATHPSGDDTTISISLKPGLPNGTYLMSWRVISADSHPISGSERFVVGSGTLQAITDSGVVKPSHTVSVAINTVHALSFAGVITLLGCWLIAVLWPAGRFRRDVVATIWAGWTVTTLGALAEFALQGPYDAGRSIGQFWRSELWRATLHASTGGLISVRLVLLGVFAAVLVALLSPDGESQWGGGLEAGAIVGTGVVVTFGASGHSQSASPRWWAVLVDSLHLSAASIWLGGLVILAVAAYGWSRRDPEQPDGLSELSAVVPIFSKVALACVATLAVTGAIQAWREVGEWRALTDTNYGRLVLVKIAVFLVLVGLGYFARGKVRRPADNDAPVEEPAREVVGSGGLAVVEQLPPKDEPPNLVHRIRRTILAEVLAGAIVLGVTGTLVSQPPGKAALTADVAKARTTTVQVTKDAQAAVTINPGRHGNVTVTVAFSGPITPTKVTATASLPDKGLGPYPVDLTESGQTSYSASGVLLPSSGTWQITLTVQTSEFDSTTAVAAVTLS